MMKQIRISLLLAILPLWAMGQLSLPAIFASRMVLQQQTNAPIWGTLKGGSQVEITTSWDGKHYLAKVDRDGKWRVAISTPKAGGPYTIKLSSGNLVKELKDILIGEVWLCSGQSNMTMPMKGYLNQPVLDANELLLAADDPELRLFTVSKATSLTEQSDCKGEWLQSNSASAKEFSAVAYLYASMLRKRLKVPVGVIVSGWGGTKIQAWMPEGLIRRFPEIEIPTSLDGIKDRHKLPITLYNAMIAPLAGYGIKGVLWYQGESNRKEVAGYTSWMPMMVKAWRDKWQQGDFPFYYVQLTPYSGKVGNTNGEFFREAQLNLMKTIPNSGMAVTMDAGMQYDIHPADKLTVAKRLAYWALNKQYGYTGLEVSGPILAKQVIEGSKIILSFDHAQTGVTSYGKPLTLFEVAGEDRVFHSAKAEISVKGVEVQSDKVAKPLAVRYAFKDWTVAELYNNEGLPASSFRTDNW